MSFSSRQSLIRSGCANTSLDCISKAGRIKKNQVSVRQFFPRLWCLFGLEQIKSDPANIISGGDSVPQASRQEHNLLAWSPSASAIIEKGLAKSNKQEFEALAREPSMEAHASDAQRLRWCRELLAPFSVTSVTVAVKLFGQFIRDRMLESENTLSNNSLNFPLKNTIFLAFSQKFFFVILTIEPDIAVGTKYEQTYSPSKWRQALLRFKQEKQNESQHIESALLRLANTPELFANNFHLPRLSSLQSDNSNYSGLEVDVTYARNVLAEQEAQKSVMMSSHVKTL